MTRLMTCWASCLVLLTISVPAWAVQGDIVSVDNWADYPVGGLLLSVPGPWKVYSSMKVFKYPPTVVVDDAHRALRLKTDHETMAIGRAMHLDVTTLSTLTWEWKPLVLPVGGDVRAYVASGTIRPPGSCCGSMPRCSRSGAPLDMSGIQMPRSARSSGRPASGRARPYGRAVGAAWRGGVAP